MKILGVIKTWVVAHKVAAIAIAAGATAVIATSVIVPVAVSNAKVEITWKNEDGSVLRVDKVKKGQIPSYGEEDPTKAATAQYSYTFAGWEPEVVKAKENAEYTAKFSSEVRKYTVTWKNENGEVLETDENVLYGTTPEYNGSAPTKAADAQYTYTHNGWDNEISPVYGDQTYTATFSSVVNKYKVRWFESDGETLIETDENVDYGTKPSFDDENPKKEKTAEITYTFDGWTANGTDVYLEDALPAITGNTDYVAHFAESKTKYTVKFLNNAMDAAIQTIENVDYDADVRDQYTGDTPTKDSAYMELAFDHWEEQPRDEVNYIRSYAPVYRDVVSKNSLFEFVDYKTDYYMIYSVKEMYDYPTLILPTEYNSKPVVGVYGSCFYDKLSNKVKKIIIPDCYVELQGQCFCWSPAEEIIIEGSPNLGQSVFHSSQKLKRVEFKGTNPYTISRAIFESCTPTNGFEVVFSEGLTSIPESCFRNSNVKTVNIPDSVTEISSTAFVGCTKLETVTLGESPSFTSIGESAFSGTTALKSFNIPESVTTLSSSAFYNSGIEEAVISDNVTTIGSSVFSHAKVKKITLGKNVTVSNITSYYLIQDCPIEEFVVSESNENLSSVEGYLFDKAGEQLVRCPAALKGEITLPSQTKSIAQSAFAGTKDLEKVIINEGVTAIPTQCFANSSVTEVEMSSTVTSIAMYAFQNSNLEKIHIGKNVSSIHNTAFSECASISEVTVDSENGSFVCEDLVLFNKSKSILKLCVKSKTGSYTIPNTVNEVANSAFMNCELNVTVPDSVSYFGDYAFREFKGTVTLGSGITKIFPSMFYEAKITSITLPSTIMIIDASAFKGSTLKSIALPDACTSIETQAFHNCVALESINLNKVQTIGYYVFTGCIKLEEVTVPESAVTVEQYAFYQSGVKEVTWNAGDVPAHCFQYCNQLESVTFSNKNEEIGVEAFYDCEKLDSIVFSTKLATIKQSAFYYCLLLETINLPASISSIALNAFVGVKATELNYAGTKEQWASVSCAPGWKGSTLVKVVCSNGPLDL